MARPGRDPRPAPRYERRSSAFSLPRPPSFNEADFSDKPSNMRDKAPVMSQEQIDQLQLDYEGRIGSLLAVDDHVRNLVRTLERTDQLDNTLIVFVSDNGWMQGEHRIPGDKFLPYEESIQVPLIIRGPGVPAKRRIGGQVSNIDFAPTLVDVADARAGRTMDGSSLLPMLRNPRLRPNPVIQLEAPRPLFEDDVPVNGWDRPYKGVRTERFTYVVYTETGDEELYDRRADPDQLRSVHADPAYAEIKEGLKSDLARLDSCRGRTCRTPTR
jgi:arylsulfatase A-like enzyme